MVILWGGLLKKAQARQTDSRVLPYNGKRVVIRLPAIQKRYIYFCLAMCYLKNELFVLLLRFILPKE